MQLEEERKAVEATLERYVREGVELYLEEKPMNPMELAACVVSEETAYMPDLVLDEYGAIRQIVYNRVTDR